MNDPKVKRGNVYKIAYFAGRKNAKRHLYMSFQAEDKEAALKVFNETLTKLQTNPENKFKTFKLYTGNWKPVEMEEK